MPDRTQVVIVGGGVIAASIAYHLTKLGWRDVVLLERRQLTAGTTWHGAGLITSAGMATETLVWMARHTRDLCVSLESETGQATGFRPICHLHLASTPQRMETLRREAAFVRGHGVDNQELPPAEFGRLIGRDALLAARTSSAPKRRLIQVLVEDPEPILYGGEPVLRDGRWLGSVRAGAYGHTLGGAVGLEMLEDEAGLPREAVDGVRFEIDVAGTRYPARASIRPVYDPDRLRIKS